MGYQHFFYLHEKLGMGKITISQVLRRRDLKNFIYLPSWIHANDRNWLPPIYMDEWELFDSRKNKSFTYADTVMYIASLNGKYVGRIMGIISHRYNEYRSENDGRFCFIESVNDQDVVTALIDAVAEWASKKGMQRLVGPLGFSDKDPQGLQIEGFEFPSIFTTATNSQYLPLLVENCGFEKKVDLVDYVADIPQSLPPSYARIMSRMQETRNTRLIEFANKKELKPYIMEVLELMNQTFTEIYGFIPLTDKEKSELAGRYLPILDPAFIKAVEVDGRLVGFAIGMPDISKGIIRSRGKLFPFGILHILRSSKRTKNLIMLLGGILKEYRGKGLDVVMGAGMLNSAIRKGMTTLDSHLVLETNAPMRAEYERIGGRIIRRFRIYQKNI